MKSNLIKDKSIEFSLHAIQVYKQLIMQKEFILSKQFLWSSTSIGANIIESEAACSRKEFVYKLTIASREARETNYWLNLMEKSDLVHYDFSSIVSECETTIRILTSIIKTSNQKDNEK